MFCPLCTAEYRDGFTLCSDCKVYLVPDLTRPEARRSRLWKGDRQTQLDGILAALDAAEIPCHFKEIVNLRTRVAIMGIPIGPRRSTFEYEVWVFARDQAQAQAATRLA